MRSLLPAIVALLLAGCGSTPTIEVSDAVVKLSPIAGRPGVAYFTLRSGGAPMKLLAVTSPRIGRIELHESGMSGAMMRMTPIEAADFSSDGELVFKAGGKHAMLFDVDPAVRPGGTIALTFDFDNAPDVTITAPVETVGG